jgi:uncharacterized membrane protein
MEWRWTGEIAEQLQSVYKQEDWGEIANLLMTIMKKLDSVKVSDRHRMGKPWIGAARKYQQG